MATYFLIENSTSQGLASIKSAPERAGGVVELAKSFGVEVIEWFFTIGPFDYIMKLEAPDDESVAAFRLAIGSKGVVTVQSLKAFTPGEWASIIARIP